MPYLSLAAIAYILWKYVKLNKQLIEEQQAHRDWNSYTNTIDEEMYEFTVGQDEYLNEDW